MTNEELEVMTKFNNSALENLALKRSDDVETINENFSKVRSEFVKIIDKHNALDNKVNDICALLGVYFTLKAAHKLGVDKWIKEKIFGKKEDSEREESARMHWKEKLDELKKEEEKEEDDEFIEGLD